MSKQKKRRPIFGICYVIFVGILTVTMIVGLVLVCTQHKTNEDQSEVSHVTYQMS